MKPKDDLFRLIKSLTTGEKRMLKLHSATEVKGKNYLRLFDAIENQAEYDEVKIKKKFSKEKFIKHLSSEKNYLQASLLRILRNNPEDRIMQEFLLAYAEIEYIFHKGLAELALEKIRKLIREAEAYCAFGIAQDMLFSERNIFIRTNRAYALERYESWWEDFERINSKQKNLAEYMRINHVTSVITHVQGNLLSDEQRKSYKKLMHSGIMRSVKYALSPCSVANFYNQRTAYYKSIDDLKNMVKYSDLLVDHFDNHPLLIRKSPENYISVLSNHVHFLQLADKAKEALYYNEKLLRFPEGKEIHLSAAAYRNKTIKGTLADIAIHLSLANPYPLEKSMTIIKNLIASFPGGDEFQRIGMMFHLGNICFLHGAYKEAMSEFNNLINEKVKGIAQHYRIAAQLLVVIIQIEKSNIDIVPYLEKKFRFSDYTGAEKLLGSFLTGDYANANSEKERITVLKKFKTVYQNNPGHRNFEHFFSFLQWIEAKIQRKTLLQFQNHTR